MVNQWTGRWTEEKDYNTYPKEQWCDYDRMAVWIRKKRYIPKIPMEDLIGIIFAEYEGEIDYLASVFDAESGIPEEMYIEAVQNFVELSGGLKEFDYKH